MRKRRNSRIKVYNVNRLFQIIEITLIILIIISLIVFIKTFLSKSNNENISISQESQINQNPNNYELQDTNNEIYNNLANINNTTNTTPTESQKDEKSNETSTFTMAVTGDIMCHNTMFRDAYDSSKETYDFSYMFDDVKYYLQTADITVGNLETTFAGPDVEYKNFPTFNTPEQLAQNLKQAGFNVVSTANNHCMDGGYDGLVSTLKYLDKADLAHTGTYSSEKDSKKILIQNVRGLSVAFLSFTYGTNGISIPSDKSYCVNISNKDSILDKLKLAKEKNPDVICVSMHWGTEYQTTPNDSQKELADFLFENGADIILGNHPHVLQPMEKRTIKLSDGSKKEGFIVYSLGNFMADQTAKYTRDSAILNLTITKNNSTGKISINSATYTPIYYYKNSSSSEHKFKILDIKSEIARYEAYAEGAVSKTTYETLVTELNNIKDLLGKEIK